MAKMYGKGKTAIESEDQQKLRWQVELEFVQCLANPNYLNFLAQRGYFKDQAFINYLKYLQYWKEPDYAKYLMYPMCLYFLDLLQYEHFRREIVNSNCCKFIDDQAILQWQHYTRKRIKMFNAVNNGMGQMNTGHCEETGDLQQHQTQQQQTANSTLGGGIVAVSSGGMQNGIGNSNAQGQGQPQQIMSQQVQQPQQQQLNGIGSGSASGATMMQKMQ